MSTLYLFCFIHAAMKFLTSIFRLSAPSSSFNALWRISLLADVLLTLSALSNRNFAVKIPSWSARVLHGLLIIKEGMSPCSGFRNGRLLSIVSGCLDGWISSSEGKIENSLIAAIAIMESMRFPTSNTWPSWFKVFNRKDNLMYTPLYPYLQLMIIITQSHVHYIDNMMGRCLGITTYLVHDFCCQICQWHRTSLWNTPGWWQPSGPTYQRFVHEQ